MKKDEYITDTELARCIVAGYDTPGFIEDPHRYLVRTADGARGDALGCAVVGVCRGVDKAFALMESLRGRIGDGVSDPEVMAAILRLPLNRANYLAMRHRPDLGLSIMLIAHELERRRFFARVPFNA